MNAIASNAFVDAPTIIPLSALRPGEMGTIVSVSPQLGASRRLLALGFVPGTDVGVRRVAPLRDPVEYSVRGACVSLRRNEASWIFVETNAR